MKYEMGEIETDVVCYPDGLIAHRPRKDGNAEFSIDELKHIVKCVNHFDELVKALEKLARLGNEPHLGNSDGNRIAQQALAAAKS